MRGAPKRNELKGKGARMILSIDKRIIVMSITSSSAMPAISRSEMRS